MIHEKIKLLSIYLESNNLYEESALAASLLKADYITKSATTDMTLNAPPLSEQDNKLRISREQMALMADKMCEWNDNLLLDFAGVVPGYGDSLDMARGLGFLRCDKYLDAFLTFIATAPGIGAAIILVKGARKISLVDELITEIIIPVAKYLQRPAVWVVNKMKEFIGGVVAWLEGQWDNLFKLNNMDIPNIEQLDRFIQWKDEALEKASNWQFFDDVNATSGSAAPGPSSVSPAAKAGGEHPPPFLDNAASSLKPTQSAGEALDAVVKHSDDEALNTVAEALRGHLENTNLHMVSDVSEVSVQGARYLTNPRPGGGTLGGFYGASTDTVYLNNLPSGNNVGGSVNAATIVHELTHTATHRVLMHAKDLKAAGQVTELTKTYDELEDLFKHVQWHLSEGPGARPFGELPSRPGRPPPLQGESWQPILSELPDPEGKFYGLKNLDEFMAEAFMNKEFQDMLKKIPYGNTRRSVWSVLWEKVAKALDFLPGDQNALAEAVDLTKRIMESSDADILKAMRAENAAKGLTGTSF